MEEEPVDDITEVSVLPTNLEMETETALKIEPSFHTNDIKIEDVVAPIDDCVAISEVQNEFDSTMLLQEEEFLFTKDGNYICDICGEIMTVRSSAERHMMQHFEKMVAEECEPTVAVTNDIIMSSSVVLPVEFVTNEIANEPLNTSHLELNEVKIECTNESLMIKSNELDGAVSTDSQCGESVSINRHYKCDICGVVLSNKNSIVEQHVGSHFETKPFECYLCTFSTNEKYRIIQHMLTHFGWDLGTRPFTCSVCAYSSNEKSRLTRHMLTHSGKKPFACDVCGFRFNRKDSLTKHMRVHVNKKMLVRTGEGEVESDSHSSRHTFGTTVSELDQQPNSSATTSSVEEVDSSVITKLEPVDAAAIADVEMSGSENEPSQDLSLGNDTTQLVILSEKLDGLSNEQVQLKTSDIMSQDWEPLGNSDSEVTQTEDNFIQCDICTYKTAKKYRYKLREHMCLHTGERPFGCDLCDHKFSRKRNLDRHRLSHSGETPYGCKLCDYACKHKSLLTKHMKIHMTKNPTDKNGSSNGQDESNDTSHDSPITFSVVDSENVDLSESCSLGDDVNARMSPNDVLMLQPSNDNPAVDPLQLRLNEEHSQDSGLSSSSGPKPASTSQKRFACDFCGYKSDKKFEFDVHLRTHTGEKPFACDLCDKRYIAKKTLNRHRKTHTLQKRCGLCDFTTMRESDLASHLKTHTQDGNTVILKEVHGEGQYELTDKPFQLELREENIRDSGPSGSSCKTTDSGELYVCDECGYKTNQKSTLDSHVMTHTGEKLFVCDHCNKSFTAKRSLDRHIWESHGEKLFNCAAVRKPDLADHIKSHVKDEIARVPSFAEASDKSYVKYIPPDDSSEAEPNQVSNNSASGNTIGVNLPEDEHFSCVHCDFECDDITAWSEHMFKHTNEKSYSCDQCEYKTKYKASMDVHKLTHAEKKPATVTCEFCDYPFTTKADMNLHIMSRHSELYISCDVCDFKAFHKRSLELHKATHLKPYACQICDYKVDKESLLTRHIMTAHADVTQFACSSCDFKAGSITDVEQHILTTHSLPAAKTASSTCVTVLPPADKVDVLIPSQPDVKQYMCYACDYSASKVTQVEEHILNSHAVLMPEISAPLLVSELPENRLDAPSSSNTGVEMYSCYACDFKASNVVEVEQHILSTHNAPASESTALPMDVTTEVSCSVLPL